MAGWGDELTRRISVRVIGLILRLWIDDRRGYVRGVGNLQWIVYWCDEQFLNLCQLRLRGAGDFNYLLW